MTQIRKFGKQSFCNFYALTALILSIIGLAAPPFALGLSGFLQDLSSPASNIPFAITIASLSVINAFPRARPLQSCLERLHDIYLSKSEKGCQKFLHILQEVYFPMPRSLLASQRTELDALLSKWEKIEAAITPASSLAEIAAAEAIANQVRNKLINFFLSVALKQIQTAHPNPWARERISEEISLLDHVGDFNDPLHDPLNSLLSILMDTSVPMTTVIEVLRIMIGLKSINTPETLTADASNPSSAAVNILNDHNAASPPPSTVTFRASTIQAHGTPDSVNDPTFSNDNTGEIIVMPPPGLHAADTSNPSISTPVATPFATRPGTPTITRSTRDHNDYVSSPHGVRTRRKTDPTTTFTALNIARLHSAAAADVSTDSASTPENKGTNIR